MNNHPQNETVLVVEDDPLIRHMAKELFSDLGCTVLDTYNALEALALIAQHPEIDLVFADVRMPGELNGLGLAKILRDTRPELKVVLTSGAKPEGLQDIAFLPKPWNARQFAPLLKRKPNH